jgi:hypothetical protein
MVDDQELWSPAQQEIECSEHESPLASGRSPELAAPRIDAISRVVEREDVDRIQSPRGGLFFQHSNDRSIDARDAAPDSKSRTREQDPSDVGALHHAPSRNWPTTIKAHNLDQ